MKKPSGKAATGKRRRRVLLGPRKTGLGKHAPRKDSVPQRKPNAPVNAVFLVGFMGAGKSSVGRALGQQLNWVFEDLDDRIERQESRTVAEIFRDSGESEFRLAEQRALANLLEELRGGGARIIALGGGAFVQERNAQLLEAAGLPRIFLDAPVEELWQRCSKQASEAGTERPLLRSREQFRELFETRRKSYASAPIRIATGNRTVEAIAEDIAQRLGLKKIEVRTEQGEVE